MPNIECKRCHQMIWVDRKDDTLAFCCDGGKSHITAREYLTAKSIYLNE